MPLTSDENNVITAVTPIASSAELEATSPACASVTGWPRSASTTAPSAICATPRSAAAPAAAIHREVTYSARVTGRANRSWSTPDE